MATLRREDLIKQIPTGAAAIPGAPGSPEYSGAPTPVAPSNFIDDALNSEVGRNLTPLAMAVPAAGAALTGLRAARLARTGAAVPGMGTLSSADIVRNSVNAAPALAAAGNGLRNTALAAGGTALAATGGLAAFGQPDTPATSATQAVAPTAVAPAPATQPSTAQVASGALRRNPLGSMADTLDQTASLMANRGPAGAGPTMSVMDGSDARQQFFDEANLRTAASRGTWSPRRGYQGDDDAVKAAALPVANRAALRRDQLQVQGQQQIAAQRDATDRRGQDISAATATAGQLSTAATAAASNARQIMESDRTYQLEVAKVGAKAAEDNFKVREDGRKSVETQLASFLPKTGDKATDDTAQAQAMQRLNAAVAQRQQQLEAAVAANPNNKELNEALRTLQTKGLASLDQTTVRALVSGTAAQDAAQRNDSFGGGRFGIGGKAVTGDAPITGLRRETRTFGDVYVSDRGDVIPAKEIEGQRGGIFTEARPNRNYDNLRRN